MKAANKHVNAIRADVCLPIGASDLVPSQAINTALNMNRTKEVSTNDAVINVQRRISPRTVWPGTRATTLRPPKYADTLQTTRANNRKVVADPKLGALIPALDVLEIIFLKKKV